MAKSGNRKYKRDVPEYLRALLQLAWETQEAMFAALEARRTDYNTREEERFKELLQRLYFRYEPKFQHSKKVDVDEDIEKQLEENGLLELSFNDCVDLCRSIRDLMEELGHTQFERELWEERKLGGKD